jgi:hypothetical protein
MLEPVRSQVVAATGDVPGAVTGGLATVWLVPAAAAATLSIRSNGAAGTVIATLQAAASGEAVKYGPFRFEGQLHLTIGGAGASTNVLT